MIKLPHIRLKQNSHLLEDPAQKQPNNIQHLSKQISKLTETIQNFCSLFTPQNNKIPHMPQHQQNNIPIHQIQSNKQLEIQERYRCVDLKVQLISDGEERQYRIKRFLVELVNTVVSKGFYYFEKQVLNQEKFRFFCCRNILYKLIQFSKINNLTLSQLEMIDQHLQDKVLPFAKANYPKSQTKGTNLKLAKMVGNMNNMNSNQNDLIYRSGIKFRKKQSGDYTPEILTFINYLIDLTKEKGQSNQETLFMKFYRDMDQFFSKVNSQYWMLNAQAGRFDISYERQEKYYSQRLQPEQSKKQRQKYQQKIKQYTKYAIGKKIPQNIKKFTDEQINQQIPELQHPSIMRILTKWIQQLQQWFQTKDSIINRQEMFRMRDGTENYIAYSDRYSLQKYLSLQKNNLDFFIQSVKKNNSFNHFNTLKENGSKIFREFVRDQESQCGYFSTLINKCYSNYLLNYLNKLLDCILSAERDWAISTYQLQENEAIIPTLITFRVGDLLRCKCSSKQNQIISLFRYLKHMSDESEQNMEIIRVKNRLNQGTKDILINIRYRNQILVEMQLSIDGDKSNFIQCSQKANHFLYELERANFGPIAQICNVWLNSSPQSAVLKKAFDENNVRKPNSKKVKCQHYLQKESLPFRCSFCTQFCSNLTNVTPNRKCMKCNIYICSKCFVELGQERDIKKPLISREDFQKYLNHKVLIREITAVDLNKKSIKQKNYVVADIKNKQYIFSVISDENNQQIRFLKEFKSKKEFSAFFQNKLIIDYKEERKKSQFFKSLEKQVFKQYIKSTEKDSKKMFNNEQSQLFLDIIKHQSMPSVERINFYCNNLIQLTLFPTVFSGCKLAYLSNNNISNIPELSKWKSLEALYLDKNNLSTLSKEISQLEFLKSLNLSWNKIKSIDPQFKPMQRVQILNLQKNQISDIQGLIKNFTNLKICYLNSNNITQIPAQIEDIKNIVQLDLGNNQISTLPQSMGNLQNLQILVLQQNRIKELPVNLFERLKKLKELWIYSNQLASLPKSIKQCRKLEKLYCQDNKLVQWPQIFQIKTIKTITFSNNVLLKHIPKQIGKLENLEQIWAQNMNLDEIPAQIGNLSKLKILILSKNNISFISQNLLNLGQLRQFYLDNNKMTKICPCLMQMHSLEKFSIENNPFRQTNYWLGKLNSLQELNIYTPSLQKIYYEILDTKNLRELRICTSNLSESSLEIVNELRKRIVVIQRPEFEQHEELKLFEKQPEKGQEERQERGKPKIVRKISVSKIK